MGLIAEFLELSEEAVEVLVLLVQVLSKVAEHELGQINLSGSWLWPTLLKTISLATGAARARVVILGRELE